LNLNERRSLRVDLSDIDMFDLPRDDLTFSLVLFVLPESIVLLLFRSKSDNGEAPRRRHLGFSHGACLDRKAETDSRGLPYKVFRGMPNVH